MAVPTGTTDGDPPAPAKKSKTGGRCRTREAKRRYLLKSKVVNVTNEEQERQKKRVAQLEKELERAKELLTAMDEALEVKNLALVEDEASSTPPQSILPDLEETEEHPAPVQSMVFRDNCDLPPITYQNWIDDDDDDEFPAFPCPVLDIEPNLPDSDDGGQQACQPLERPLDQLIVGIIGHVAHGKSSVVKMLTGKSTMVFREERLANSTIKLGYADACIYRSLHTLRGRRRYFMQGGSVVDTNPKHPETDEACEFVRKISFVDCPGHDKYIDIMIAGAAVMDAALVVVAANEDFPQPQMMEHLQAIRQASIRSDQIVVVHNKVDLVGPTAVEHLPSIRSLVGQDAAVVPCCAVQSGNKESIIEALVHLDSPERDTTSSTVLQIIRSFDINKKGKSTSLGGVLGGAVLKGHLKLNDTITLYPGLRQDNGVYNPIKAKIVSLTSEGISVTEARPGALIGVGTNIPANLSQADRLVGQIGGILGETVEVFTNKMQIIEIDRRRDTKGIKVKRHKNGEYALLMAGPTKIVAKVVHFGKHALEIVLSKAVAVTPMQRVAISRKDSTGWRIVAWGTIKTSMALPTPYLKYDQVNPSRKHQYVSSENALQAFYRSEIEDDPSLSDFNGDLKTRHPVAEPIPSLPVHMHSVPSNEIFNVYTDSDDGDEAGLKKRFKKKRKKIKVRPAASDSDVEPVPLQGDAAYAGLLYQALDNITVKDALAKPFRLPPPRVIKLTRHCVGIANFDAIVKNLNRSQEHIRTFIGVELSTTTSVDQNGCLILGKNFKSSNVEVVLRKYAWLYVICLMCSSGTNLERADRGIFELQCPKCLAIRSVPAQQATLYAPATKKSRRRVRDELRKATDTEEKPKEKKK